MLLFAFNLLCTSVQEEGLIKSIFKPIKQITKPIVRTIHHTSTSIIKEPIVIGDVSSKRSNDLFTVTSMEQAAAKLSAYGFSTSELMTKFKKASMHASRFQFEINRFCMDIHPVNKFMRTSDMQRAVIKGKKEGDAIRISFILVNAHTNVESKLIKKETGRTIGIKSGSSVHNEFRPLEVSELQQIFDALQNAINKYLKHSIILIVTCRTFP